tara:strand:- start:1289 stop:1633 length:345 start_codon:yes stop_codon:yes gene_type:complete
MDWDALLKAEAKREQLRRKTMGERSTLHSRKRRSDPHRNSKVPDIPVVPIQNLPPNWTKQITDTSLPDTPPSVDRAIQTQHITDLSKSNLKRNAEEQLEDLRKQLRKAYGLGGI